MKIKVRMNKWKYLFIAIIIVELFLLSILGVLPLLPLRFLYSIILITPLAIGVFVNRSKIIALLAIIQIILFILFLKSLEYLSIIV